MTAITGCRNCGGTDLMEVLDLGQQYLSDFPGPGQHDRTSTWPLRLVRCAGCGLVQLDTTTPRELLYHDGYGFHSGVNEGIVADLQDVVRHALYYRPEPRYWLDIAANDGTLLAAVPHACYKVGVDPVRKFQGRGADLGVCGYFPDVELGLDAGVVDVITAISVFYDLDDPNGFLAECARLLDDKGVLVIQQNYLPAMLATYAYDNVCHEHLTYWALDPFLKALERHGLEAIDVRTSPVNGGVFRVVAGHRGVRTRAPSVAEHRYAERRILPGLLGGFAGAVGQLTKDLHDLVASIVADGGRVQVLGASTRGAVIWQAAGLARAVTATSSGGGSDPSAFSYRPWLEAAVERNPEKVGCHYAAVGIPIISEEEMRADPPDYLLVGPWWFRGQFVSRYRDFLSRGGAMIFPLPSVEVVRR